ncbi:MAG TPA: UDP-N-acetylglucosamine 2-epimerase (non-hydrolyzing) [Gaiellaceae bacterium]
MRVLSVVGNRPQFIKSAPLSAALREAEIEEVLLHTGQHYDRELSQLFFEELELGEPAYRLEAGALPREEMIERMKPGILTAIETERPNWVLVFGDTNSTLAGAQAASDAGVRIAHVEAGLRSGDWSMPEERNRVEVDRTAQLLFCPDERSVQILRGEGVVGEALVVGDVMGDAARLFAPLARTRSRVLERFSLEPKKFVLVTVHREANVTQPRLGRIVAGLNALDERIVFPIHPRTRAALVREKLTLGPQVELTEPLGYLDLTALASQARVIATDSGGLQKEAYWYGVPCVTMRPSTEWADTVELGANALVDDDPAKIARAVAEAQMPADLPALYGDGHASEKIAAALLSRA